MPHCRDREPACGEHIDPRAEWGAKAAQTGAIAIEATSFVDHAHVRGDFAAAKARRDGRCMAGVGLDGAQGRAELAGLLSPAWAVRQREAGRPGGGVVGEIHGESLS